MTIKQYAEQQGISPQAVYQRLKKNKIKVESLTEKGSGELTGEGTVILDKLFSPENRQIKPIKDEKIEALEKQIADLRTEVSSKDELIKSLERMYASIQDERDFLRKALDKAQEIQADTLKRLPGEGQTVKGRKLTWRERFTGKVNDQT